MAFPSPSRAFPSPIEPARPEPRQDITSVCERLAKITVTDLGGLLRAVQSDGSANVNQRFKSVGEKAKTRGASFVRSIWEGGGGRNEKGGDHVGAGRWMFFFLLLFGRYPYLGVFLGLGSREGSFFGHLDHSGASCVLRKNGFGQATMS